MTDKLTMALTARERDLLAHGVIEWGGPARCTSAFALAMGFADVDDLHARARILLAAVEEDEPLSAEDWRRVVLMTELVFASDLVGAGLDWQPATGLDDEVSVRLLRAVQRKLPREVRAIDRPPPRRAPPR